MRKITVGTFVSIDGVVQAPGGPDEDTSGGFDLGGWVFGYFDEMVGASIGEMLDGSYELLLGRKTYDIFASYWPKVTDPSSPNIGIAKAFNSTVKHVATHRSEGLTWNNTQSLGADPVAKLRELKKSDGPRLLVQGSGDFLRTLFASDLVDELRLVIFPIVLGKGKRLFNDGAAPSGFKVTSSKTSPNGVVLVTYTRDGEVKRGAAPEAA